MDDSEESGLTRPREVWTALNWMDRSKLEEILRSVSIECYPNETDDELKEAIVANIDDGTLDEDTVINWDE